MTRVAIASSSQIAADAGADAAETGGNAVDAGHRGEPGAWLVTEPGVVSLAGGAIIVIWPAGEYPIMIDGASEMPGPQPTGRAAGRRWPGRDALLRRRYANHGGLRVGRHPGRARRLRARCTALWLHTLESARGAGSSVRQRRLFRYLPRLNATLTLPTQAYSAGTLLPCARCRTRKGR